MPDEARKDWMVSWQTHLPTGQAHILDALVSLQLAKHAAPDVEHIGEAIRLVSLSYLTQWGVTPVQPIVAIRFGNTLLKAQPDAGQTV